MNATTTIDFETAVSGDTVTLQTSNGNVKVKIPAGVSNGQKIRLRGKGEPGQGGTPAGDLLLTVTVRKHPVFERDGLNLKLKLPVTFTEATLGATVEVPTLGGDTVRLRVQPGTPSGRVLRVKGRGVKTSKGTGDLLAEVQVAVPSHLSDAAPRSARGVQAGRTTGEPAGRSVRASANVTEHERRREGRWRTAHGQVHAGICDRCRIRTR